jgi:hypothetical protein
MSSLLLCIKITIIAALNIIMHGRIKTHRVADIPANNLLYICVLYNYNQSSYLRNEINLVGNPKLSRREGSWTELRTTRRHKCLSEGRGSFTAKALMVLVVKLDTTRWLSLPMKEHDRQVFSSPKCSNSSGVVLSSVWHLPSVKSDFDMGSHRQIAPTSDTETSAFPKRLISMHLTYWRVNIMIDKTSFLK